MAAWRYKISLLVFKNILLMFASFPLEIFSYTQPEIQYLHMVKSIFI